MKILLVICFLYTSFAFSKCEPVAWPYSKSENDIVQISRTLNIDDLHQYYIHEITSSKDGILATLLFKEIELNEERTDFVAFSRLLAYSSGITENKFKKLDKEEVCAVFNKFTALN